MHRISPNNPYYIQGRIDRDEGKGFDATNPEPWRRGWNDRNEELPLFIDVLTCTRNPNEPPVQTHRINFHSDSARKWLIKHQWWSLHQGFTVHIATVEG